MTEAIARARFSRGSARKVRRVTELIRGKNVEEALNILGFVPKYAAQYLEKILKSATANAISQEGTTKLKAEDLYVKKIFVDGGPIMKRIRANSMGRAYRINKRTNHLTVVVSDKDEDKSKKVKTIKVKEKEIKPEIKLKGKDKSKEKKKKSSRKTKG